MWLVPKTMAFVVIPDDPEAIANTSAYFSSARTGILCALQADVAFPIPKRLSPVRWKAGVSSHRCP